MAKFLYTICVITLFLFECMHSNCLNAGQSVEIHTPNHTCMSDFEIQAPAGWGYRGFFGKSGLIGVLWPYDKTFKETNVAIFIFLENLDDINSQDENVTQEVKHLNVYTEKCSKSTFHFSNPEDNENKSLFNKYFNGRCGNTMILFSEKIEHMNLIVSISSSDYLSKQHLNAAKTVVKKYKKILQEYVEVGKENKKYMNSNSEENEDELEDENENEETEQENTEQENDVQKSKIHQSSKPKKLK